jgi:Ca2+-binding EF-hand superfamily protein
MRSQIDIEDYYEAIEEQRSIYGDGIFELLDITHAGNIGFGEFIQSIVVMCLFEYEEIMKYCFYVFDKDKNGYVEKAELDTILNVFHHVGAGEKLVGNPAKAKKSLKIPDDGKVRVVGVVLEGRNWNCWVAGIYISPSANSLRCSGGV